MENPKCVVRPTMPLKTIILHKLKEQNEPFEKFAKMAGYKQPDTFRNILMNEDLPFNHFNGLIKLVRFLFPDRELELLSEYALTVDPNQEFARSMLEYLSVNRIETTKEMLMVKMLNCSSSESRECAEIHQVDSFHEKKKFTSFELISKSNANKYRSTEVKIFAKIIQIYEYYQSKNLVMVNIIGESLFEQIVELKNDYIRDSYLMRLCLILATMNLYKNQLNDCRKYCNMGIERSMNDRFTSIFLLTIGNSYIFENYDVASKILKKSYIISPEGSYQKKQVKRSLMFLNNVWKKDIALECESLDPEDIHEEVFRLINKNNKEDAQEAFNKISVDDLNENQLAYNHYFRYLLTGEDKYLFQSVKSFMKNDDHFFIKLPMKELEKIGVNKHMMDELKA